MGEWDTEIKEIKNLATGIGRRNTSDLAPESIEAVKSGLSTLRDTLAELHDLLWEQLPSPIEKWANQVYDVLVEHAGASEGNREMFVHTFPRMGEIREYRFVGALGFGGKYWAPNNQHPNGCVTCYPEDASRNNGLNEIVTRTNDALDLMVR